MFVKGGTSVPKDELNIWNITETAATCRGDRYQHTLHYEALGGQREVAVTICGNCNGRRYSAAIFFEHTLNIHQIVLS